MALIFSGYDDESMEDITLMEEKYHILDWPCLPEPYSLPIPEDPWGSLPKGDRWNDGKDCFQRLTSGRFKAVFRVTSDLSQGIMIEVSDLGPRPSTVPNSTTTTTSGIDNGEQVFTFTFRFHAVDNKVRLKIIDNYTLSGSLKEYVKEDSLPLCVLPFRILHVLFRCGYDKIAQMFLITSNLMILEGVIDHLVNLEFWLDVYDLKALKARILQGSNQPELQESVEACVRTAGHALEAVGEIRAAVSIYKTSASTIASSGLEKAGCYCNAGEAYAKLLNFEEGEKAYIKALHYALEESGPMLDVNKRPTLGILQRLIDLYDLWTSFHNPDNDKYVMGRSMPETYLLSLIALLSKLNFGGASNPTMATSILIRDARPPAKAKKILSNAVRSGKVDVFHDTLQKNTKPPESPPFWIDSMPNRFATQDLDGYVEAERNKAYQRVKETHADHVIKLST